MPNHEQRLSAKIPLWTKAQGYVYSFRTKLNVPPPIREIAQRWLTRVPDVALFLHRWVERLPKVPRVPDQWVKRLSDVGRVPHRWFNRLPDFVRVPPISVDPRITEAIAAALLGSALALVQTFIGGTRLLFSLPAYGLLAIVGLLALFSVRRAKPEPDHVCLWSAAAFFAYVLGRALLSPVPYLARFDIYSVLGALIVYFFVACVFTAPRQRMWLLSFLLLLGIIHVWIGAIQFRDGTNFMPISFLQRYDYDRRASGFYICPNHLAGLLEVLGIFGLSIACWSRWPVWVKALIGYAVAACYFGLVLTGSRGGYLSTVASMLVFAGLSLIILRRGVPHLFWRIAGAGFIAAAVVGVTVVFFILKSDFLSGRAQNIFERKNQRLDYWHAALQQWGLQPFWGTGSGTYLYYGRQFRTEQMQLDPVQVHNDYLHLLAEYGLIGTVFFLFFLGAHLRNGWKNFERLGGKRLTVSPRLTSNGLAVEIGALAAVSAYVVHSFLDFNLHIPANALLLAVVFGILANAGVLSGPQPMPSVPRARWWHLVTAAIGLILLVQCLRLLPAEYFTERSRTALRDGEPAASALFALRALAREKRNPNLYGYMGNARAALAESTPDPGEREFFYQEAIDAFWKKRELAPRDHTAAVDLGFSYDALGRFTEAEWMFQDALKLDPKSNSVRRYYEAHLEKWRRGITALSPNSE